MDLAKEFRDLEVKIQDTLKKMIENSGKVSRFIAGQKALKVNVFDYIELVFLNERLTFIDSNGNHFSVYAECTTEDLLDIIKENEHLLQPKHKVKRVDLYDFAAGLFLSNDGEKSPAVVYDELVNIWEIVGDGDDLASTHAVVWKPFENYTVEELLELIDDTVENLKEKFNFEEV
ncbi:MAG: hypothetical protein ACOC2U_04460 [bacterium]